MKHPLEDKYGLSAGELLDAMARRFRASVTLEGAVAEVQMQKKIQALMGQTIERFETHDRDDYPDFSIWLHDRDQALLVECKNVRDSEEAYRKNGQIVAFKVEVQKTRASRKDPTSRFYDMNRFHILGVCLGKKTGRWTDFAFARADRLLPHRDYPTKLAVMQKVPLTGKDTSAGWYSELRELIATWK